jgi:lysophospholipid acyltransferase (LPLAT)-like uncharacterized protein
MSEKTKAILSLIAIAVLIAFAQTMDYKEQIQQEAVANTRQNIYIAWHNEALAATGETK